MNFRNYLTGTIFVVLLIWGPIDNTWAASLAVRIGYLILIPLTVWFLLGWIWINWTPTEKAESSLNRTLSGIICISLFGLAYLQATSKTHIGNTQWIQTRDGMEAVGEDILLQGADYGNVFVILIIAGLVFWFGVIKSGVKSKDSGTK